MEIKKILEKKIKINSKKENSLGLIFELFEKNNIILDEKEKITFEKYIKNSKLEEREVFDVINTLLKDKNKDTVNIKGRIVAELKKNYKKIKKNKTNEVKEDMMISTHIQTRHIPFFSPSTKRLRGNFDEEDKVVIRKFIDNDYSITLYNQDLNFFDEKILHILCDLAVKQKTKQGEKVFFTLREICRILKIPPNTNRIADAIRRLNNANFEFAGFLMGDSRIARMGFNFIYSFFLIEEKENKKNNKSYVILNEVLGAQIGNLKKFKKVEQKKYLHISNGWEFKIFSYVDILAKSKKEITVDIKTLLCRGLSICGNELEDVDKIKSNNRRMRQAIKKLKENKIIKDYKIIGRGKDIKITFYLN